MKILLGLYSRSSTFLFRSSGALKIQTRLLSATTQESTAVFFPPEDKKLNLKIQLTLPKAGKTTFYAPLKQTLGEFILDLKEEDRSIKKVEIKFENENKEDKNEKSLEDLTLYDSLLKGNFALLINNIKVPCDLSRMNARRKENQALIEKVGLEYSKLMNEKYLIDRRAGWWGNGIRLLLGGYLVGQLGVVVVLTYSLGWDLMEPITYLLGLTSSIITYFVYILTKADFAYEAQLENYFNSRRNQAYEKRKLNLQTLAHLHPLVSSLSSSSPHSSFAISSLASSLPSSSSSPSSLSLSSSLSQSLSSLSSLSSSAPYPSAFAPYTFLLKDIHL